MTAFLPPFLQSQNCSFLHQQQFVLGTENRMQHCAGEIKVWLFGYLFHWGSFVSSHPKPSQIPLHRATGTTRKCSRTNSRAQNSRPHPELLHLIYQHPPLPGVTHRHDLLARFLLQINLLDVLMPSNKPADYSDKIPTASSCRRLAETTPPPCPHLINHMHPDLHKQK